MGIENINSVADAVSDRIRSPFIGSIVLTAILYNWEPLTVLVFSEISLETKIINFKEALEWHNYIWPLAIGSLFSLSVPWLNLIVNRWLQRPAYLNSQNADKWAVRRARARTELEDTLATESEARRRRTEAEAKEEEAARLVNISNLEKKLKAQAVNLKSQIEKEKKIATDTIQEIKGNARRIKSDIQGEIDSAQAQLSAAKEKLDLFVAGRDDDAIELLRQTNHRLNTAAETERNSRVNLKEFFEHSDPILDSTKQILRAAFSNQELELLDCAVVTGQISLGIDADWTTVTPIDLEAATPVKEKGFIASNERINGAIIRLEAGGFLSKLQNDNYILSAIGRELATERLSVALLDPLSFR